MATPYIPSRQAQLVLWATNFAAIATASPSVYGFSAGDLSSINGVVNAFSAALTVATDPSTRTSTTVAAKDAARAAMLDVIRPFAVNISQSTGISDEDKLAIGVTVRNPTPTPIPAPVTQPVLSIVSATHLQQTLRFSDALTPDKRAKPPGAIGLQLFRHIGTTPPVGPSVGSYVANATKNPFAVNFLEADIGKMATFWGRWVTRTGLVGPWSLPVSMAIG
jgi:hypothetical protein